MTRVALVDDDRFLDHRAASHVERPERLRAVSAAIAGAADLADLVRIQPAFADDSVLLRVHSAAHISAVEAMSQSGGGWFDVDTYCTDRSAGTARLAAGSAVAVCDAVLAGDVRHGVALIRPPGHHAGRDTAMGFCLYNNAAIVVRHAQESGASRVAVIDIDVHHGNGTEEIVWNDTGTLYTSIHQMPLFPGTGRSADRGAHDNVVNIPVPPGTGSDEWLQHFDETIVPAVSRFGADLVVVSAGYDAHELDPLGGLRLTTTTYGEIAARIRDLCSYGPVGSVWVLEGGYDLTALGDSVVATLRALQAE